MEGDEKVGLADEEEDAGAGGGDDNEGEEIRGDQNEEMEADRPEGRDIGDGEGEEDEDYMRYDDSPTEELLDDDHPAPWEKSKDEE